MKKILIILVLVIVMTGCSFSININTNNNSSNNNSNSNVVYIEYTDEEIEELARKYYEKKSGDSGKIVEVDHEEGDNVVIHIYEVVNDHTATIDWYTVDKKTLKGKNILNEDIDLNK